MRGSTGNYVSPTKMPLYCCICGQAYEVSVNQSQHGFAQACCSEPCKNEKSRRFEMSLRGTPFSPKP